MKFPYIKIIMAPFLCVLAQAQSGSGFFDNTPPSSNSVPVAQKSDASYFSIAGGPAFMLIQTAGNPYPNYWKDSGLYLGCTAALAWRFNADNIFQVKNEYFKIQIDIGYFKKTTAREYYDEYFNAEVSTTFNFMAISVLFSPSWCVPLGKSGRWDLRVTPSIGLMLIDQKISASGDPKMSSSGITGAFLAYGLGTGVTCQLNRLFYIDAGYRFLATKNDYSPQLYTHTISLLLGAKF